MGTTDIKQSLKIKQRQDRSRSLHISEETEPGALLTLGLREMRFGDINIAINCINKVYLCISLYIILIFLFLSTIEKNDLEHTLRISIYIYVYVYVNDRDFS
jgi:hypothetical protein